MEEEKKELTISYVKGDATAPVNSLSDEKHEVHYIAHICNDADQWGKGFVMALSEKWPWLKGVYHRDDKKLGGVNIYTVKGSHLNGKLVNPKELLVVNMIAQHGVSKENGVKPIRYDSLRLCLKRLAEHIKTTSNKDEFECSTIHMPRIGCGLAGGKWSKVEPIIKEEVISRGIPVVVYNL